MSKSSVKFKQFMQHNMFSNFKDFGKRSVTSFYSPKEDPKIFLGISNGAVNVSKKVYDIIGAENILILFDYSSKKMLISPSTENYANGVMKKYDYSDGHSITKINRPCPSVFKLIANKPGTFRAYGMIAKDGKSIVFDFDV